MVDILNTDITDNSDPNENDGTGTFDKWMCTVESHIEKQFQDGRFTGTDYATVYLGSLQATLQAAITFELQRQVAGKQVDLIDAQIAEAAATTIRNDSLAAAEISLKDAQELDIEYITVNHRPEQTIQLQEQIDLLETQDLIAQENVLTQAEVTLKTAEEVALLSQKVLTELAQTSDTDAAPYGTGGTALTGVLGAQRQLYKTQAQGFVAKHHVDVVKTMADVHAVVYAITEGTEPAVPRALLDTTQVADTDLDTEIIDMKAAMDTIP